MRNKESPEESTWLLFVFFRDALDGLHHPFRAGDNVFPAFGTRLKPQILLGYHWFVRAINLHLDFLTKRGPTQMDKSEAVVQEKNCPLVFRARASKLRPPVPPTPTMEQPSDLCPHIVGTTFLTGRVLFQEVSHPGSEPKSPLSPHIEETVSTTRATGVLVGKPAWE